MRAPFLVAVLFAATLAFPSLAPAAERSFDGGAHIWFGGGWGEFRAYAGPRWHWGGFTLYPYGALGAAFFPGVSGSPLTLGVYGDADYLIDLGGHERAVRVGAGGGAGHIVGLYDMTGAAIPQGYGQVGYRWGINFVGIQGLWGPRYTTPAGFPTGFPSQLRFTGLGLRFEYEIEAPRNE